MRSHARVVIIGGGIGGCSTLYHLARLGWTDVVLVERDELTSGSTWHAAAQVTNFGAVPTMVRLKSHSIALYAELARDPEHPIDYHVTGGIRLAHGRDHLDGYRHFAGMARAVGVDFEVIGPAECGERHPLLRTEGLAGGLWDPLDGDIDPSQLTQALARGAREAGATISRFNPVEAIERTRGGEWRVHTREGPITCERVVNASGYRVNEVGRMLGVEHPVVSMEHMYFLTEPVPELEAMDRRVPILRCPGDDFYSRQEKKGLLVGLYEQGCRTFGLDGIDPGFSMQLLPDDLDRCLDNVERVFARLPVLAETGIRTVVNGPITYSADGLPLVGPVPGLRHAYACLGLRAGIGEGGGHGKILADIIVHGEPEWDAWCLDPRRFGPHCTVEHTAEKAIEEYRNEFRFHFPNEHRPAAREARTTPLYPVLRDAGARFGTVDGWERALLFAPEPGFEDRPSFRYTRARDVVAAEVAAVHERVGLMEVSGFGRIEVEGPGAAAWLDRLYAARIPREGRVALAYSVTARGSVLGEATVARLGGERFWLGVAAPALRHDLDWLRERLPAAGVSIADRTADRTLLVLAGPRARALLEAVSPREDWSRGAFPWLAVRPVRLGRWPAVAMRVSFSGELAFELHVANEHLLGVHALLRDAGEALGLAPFGLHAAESMRLEKGFRHWKADLTIEATPFEAGLERFVRLDKGDFEGREALLRLRGAPLRHRFAVMAVADGPAPAHEGDAVHAPDGSLAGSVTSGGHGHRVGTGIAFAYLDPALAREGTGVEVEILGERRAARVAPECLFDPGHARARG